MPWTPVLPAAGRWKVYARWASHANRATDAPYRVHHAGGATTIRVNQEHNGGDWVLLGAFDLAPGANHRVVLTDDANQYVIADAVRFVRDAGPLAAEETTIDNLDPRTLRVGSWSSHSTTTGAGYWDGNISYRAAGSGAKSFTWPAAVPAAERIGVRLALLHYWREGLCGTVRLCSCPVSVVG